MIHVLVLNQENKNNNRKFIFLKCSKNKLRNVRDECMNSYVKIDRNILDWEWWSDIKTSRLFFYMILKANWKDSSFKGINISRGSFVSSLAKLSEGTNLTVDEVRTALKHLKSTNEITSKSYGKFTVFTINNYNTYQDNNEKLTNKVPNKSQEDTKQIPSKSQADTKQTPSKSQEDTEQIPSSYQEDTKQIPSSYQPIPKLLPTIEERKEEKENITVIVSNETICQTDVQRVIEKWNNLQSCGITPISRLGSNSKRYKSLMARIREYGISNVLTAMDRIAASDFLQGKNNKGWVITFDWFVLPNNFPKVFEGNYKVNQNVQKSKKNNFGNFEQRVYDFNLLEGQLLSN